MGRSVLPLSFRCFCIFVCTCIIIWTFLGALFMFFGTVRGTARCTRRLTSSCCFLILHKKTVELNLLLFHHTSTQEFRFIAWNYAVRNVPFSLFDCFHHLFSTKSNHVVLFLSLAYAF